MNETIELRKKMIERVKENEKEAIENNYKDEVANSMYAFCSEFSFEVDYTYCENASDNWIEASVYVKNLLGDEGDEGYNVIIDVEAKSRFETVEEFVDYMIEVEKKSKKILNHFNL